MRADLIDLAHELRLVTDTEVFWDRIGVESKQFSIGSFLYGAAASRKEIAEKGFSRSLITKNNYPKCYFDASGVDDFLDNDVTCVHALRFSTPLFWDDESCLIDATPEQIALYQDSTDLGFGVGLTISKVAISPGHIGGIGLRAENITSTEFGSLWEAKSVEIMQLLSFFDFSMRRTHLSKMLSLSQREKEVLSWLAGGLRPDQISDRLGIGYRTVDKYVNFSKQKLNASTRDQAVAKALIFNVIQP